MAAGPLHKTLEPLRQLAATQFFADWPDRALLERFLSERDQAAFAELVHRHRRLVWSLCRHLLGHEQDAEDAFQATFLVLAVKGRSIRKVQSLASWLHGVAYRCAMQIKRQEMRRQRREKEAARGPSYDPAQETNVRELAALLQLRSNICRKSIALRSCSAAWRARARRTRPGNWAGKRERSRDGWRGRGKSCRSD